MTRNALWFAALATVAAGTVGWVAGLLSSTRINTAGWHYYMEAQDFKAQARESAVRAEYVGQAATCEYDKAVLRESLASQERTFQRLVQDEQTHYTERILGLREQLQAAGVRPAVAR